jgi:hypothetical protein
MGPKAKAKAAPANRKNDPPSIDLPSRISGSFIGLAVCDALGGPVEFKARGSYPLHTEMTYNDVFGLEAGSWTDDTSTALCLAESLVEYKGESHIGDQVERYIAWWREGYLSVNGKVEAPDSIYLSYSHHFAEYPLCIRPFGGTAAVSGFYLNHPFIPIHFASTIT